jgi:hypothetical protein
MASGYRRISMGMAGLAGLMSKKPWIVCKPTSLAILQALLETPSCILWEKVYLWYIILHYVSLIVSSADPVLLMSTVLTS